MKARSEGAMSEAKDLIRFAIATRLREARKLAGLSQDQVAALLTLHRPAISEIEAGNRRVAAEELMKFAETYAVTPSWLLGVSTKELETDDPQFQKVACALRRLKPNDFDRVTKLLATMLKSSRYSEQ